MAWKSGPRVARAKEGNQRQGRMTSHRRISIVALTAAMAAISPVVASASSLLSGYGGPGQGSQAILGSALLGGGSGGGGGDGSSSSSNGGSSGSSSGSFRYGESAGGTGSAAAGAVRAGGKTTRKSSARGASSSRAGAGGTSGGGTYPASSTEKAPGTGAGGSETLGLSGEDLLYILLVLAALAFTGVLTGRLARTHGAGGHRPLKGGAAGPE